MSTIFRKPGLVSDVLPARRLGRIHRTGSSTGPSSENQQSEMTEAVNPVTHVTAMKAIQTVEQLEQRLSEPTERVVEAMRRLPGDIILLGAGGKIGPSLARMARRASDLAGGKRRVIGRSRFSLPNEEARLQAQGVETIRCDLLDEAAVAQLPTAPNVIYLAGLKFGSTENAAGNLAVKTHPPRIRWPQKPSS